MVKEDEEMTETGLANELWMEKLTKLDQIIIWTLFTTIGLLGIAASLTLLKLIF